MLFDSTLLFRESVFKFPRFPSSDGMIPVRPLYANDSDVRAVSNPRFDGMEFDSLLLFSESAFNFTRLLSSDGMLVVRPLYAIDSVCKAVNLPRNDGMELVNMLLFSNSVFNFTRLPSSNGIVPVKMFEDRSKDVRLTILNTAEGMLSDNLLEARWSWTRVDSITYEGKGHDNWFPLSLREVRLNILPNTEGIEPIRTLYDISIASNDTIFAKITGMSAEKVLLFRYRYFNAVI